MEKKNVKFNDISTEEERVIVRIKSGESAHFFARFCMQKARRTPNFAATLTTRQ